jgi:tRNA (cytidine32/uridine32-2'-O)-methyltransferase
MAAEGELALVFGREDSGLTDAELDRCTHLVHLASADEYPSFNLAQSVLLAAYQLRLAGLAPALQRPLAPPAEHVAREALYEHLQRALLAIGFLHADSVEPIMRRLRRLLGRAEMTAEEVHLLRGVARRALWVAARAGATATEPDQSTPESAESRG